MFESRPNSLFTKSGGGEISAGRINKSSIHLKLDRLFRPSRPTSQSQFILVTSKIILNTMKPPTKHLGTKAINHASLDQSGVWKTDMSPTIKPCLGTQLHVVNPRN